ncbi:MAG: phosphopantetheine-binding protein, partial [Pirellulales bacterium]
MAQGYWRRPDDTEHAFRARLRDNGQGDYLRTGDLGFFQDGELFVAGRLKDLIIIRGLNHYPHDIELTVEKCHGAVRPGSGAAFTVDVDDEPKLIIVYEVERRQQGEVDDVFEAIRRDVGREHELQVDTIVLIKPGSIPKTSSGKIQRHACRKAYLDGTLEEVARSSTAVDFAPETQSAPEPASPGVAAPGATPSVARPDVGQTEATAATQPAALRRTERPVVPAAKSKAEINKTVAEQVLDEVHRIAKERARGLSLDSSIVELGLDSLERMEMLASLEERFGGRFPEEVLPQLETC